MFDLIAFAAELINNTPDDLRFWLMDVTPYEQVFEFFGWIVFEDGSLIRK